MQKYIIGKDVEGLKEIESGTYDVVCSSGVFLYHLPTLVLNVMKKYAE